MAETYPTGAPSRSASSTTTSGRVSSRRNWASSTCTCPLSSSWAAISRTIVATPAVSAGVARRTVTEGVVMVFLSRSSRGRRRRRAGQVPALRRRPGSVGQQWAYSEGRSSMATAIAGSINTWPQSMRAPSLMTPSARGTNSARKGRYIAAPISTIGRQR